MSGTAATLSAARRRLVVDSLGIWVIAIIVGGIFGFTARQGGLSLIEAILTAVLVYTVLLATADARAPKLGALLVGGVVTANILIGGLLTGAAMNPARWFGPALAFGDLSAAAVYIVGPLIGAVVAALSVRYLFAER